MIGGRGVAAGVAAAAVLAPRKRRVGAMEERCIDDGEGWPGGGGTLLVGAFAHSLRASPLSPRLPACLQQVAPPRVLPWVRWVCWLGWYQRQTGPCAGPYTIPSYHPSLMECVRMFLLRRPPQHASTRPPRPPCRPCPSPPIPPQSPTTACTTASGLCWCTAADPAAPGRPHHKHSVHLLAAARLSGLPASFVPSASDLSAL